MLTVGTKVRVKLPSYEYTLSNTVRTFNRAVTEIERVHRTPKSLPMYVLKGCYSKYGMPFFFLEEWLVELDDEESEVDG